MPTIWEPGLAVKPQSTEVVGHASVNAQNRLSTEDDHVKHHMAFVKKQTNETQTDFTTQSCVEVVGESDMRVQGLVDGTAVEWIIDTGAENTFISEQVYLSILQKNRPVLEKLRNNLKLQMVDH